MKGEYLRKKITIGVCGDLVIFSEGIPFNTNEIGLSDKTRPMSVRFRLSVSVSHSLWMILVDSKEDTLKISC